MPHPSMPDTESATPASRWLPVSCRASRYASSPMVISTPPRNPVVSRAGHERCSRSAPSSEASP